MYRIKHRLSVLIVAGLLVACGGDDDSADADSADADDTEQSADNEGDEGGAPADGNDDDSDSDDGDGGDAVSADPDTDAGDVVADVDSEDSEDGNDDQIVITDFDDIPSECIDLMADFLRDAEPIVSELDWQNATIDDLQTFGLDLEVPTDDFDRRAAETGCDRYDIGADDDQSLAWAIQIAEREAPGTVGWLQFIAGMSGLGETVGDVIDPDDPDDGTATGTGDCQETQAFLLEKAEEYGTFSNVPVSEIGVFTTAIGELTQQCTIGELEAFYENPAIATFLEE